jgi:hypothetical protein
MKTLLLLLLITPAAYSLELKVEPVYGFERSYQHTPKPGRYKTEAFAGISATYGADHLAGELELNQGSTSYSIGEIDNKTTTQNLLFGVRLMPFAKAWYNLYFRSGMRVRKETREITTNGESSIQTDGVQYDPYAGSGLSLNISNLFSLNASATLVFNRDAAESEKYDTRYTFGASFKFGNKSF